MSQYVKLFLSDLCDIQIKPCFKWGTLDKIESIHVEGVVVDCNNKHITLDDGTSAYSFNRSTVYEKDISLNQYILLGLELDAIGSEIIFIQKLFINLSNQVNRKEIWNLEVLHARRYLYNMSLPLNNNSSKSKATTTTTTTTTTSTFTARKSTIPSKTNFNLTTSDLFKKNDPIEFTDVFNNSNNSSHSLTGSEKDEMQTFDYDFSGISDFNNNDDSNNIMLGKDIYNQEEEEENIPVYEEIEEEEEQEEQEEEQMNVSNNKLNFDDEWDEDFI
ncbi:hypothetical protein CYY_002734 [Polysphondylium violaceum]|uniref:Uncharacterized protein n=1 Tax=Polysphondylium violaceum TaxID=133409 RepID=A0A8J4PVV8_9MYCE|nr:hypothetical protein CYY_002734 [Polysphondylium violaceum]